MKIKSPPAEMPRVCIWVTFFALFTSGCTTGPVTVEEKQSLPERSFVKAQPAAKSPLKISGRTPILEQQEKEIEKNEALLERQRRQIQGLKVRLGEY